MKKFAFDLSIFAALFSYSRSVQFLWPPWGWILLRQPRRLRPVWDIGPGLARVGAIENYAHIPSIGKCLHSV